MDKKYLATITILIKDRQNHAPEVNKILTDNGHLIIARLGVNLQKRCVENCTALITVVIEGNNEEIIGGTTCDRPFCQDASWFIYKNEKILKNVPISGEKIVTSLAKRDNYVLGGTYPNGKIFKINLNNFTLEKIEKIESNNKYLIVGRDIFKSYKDIFASLDNKLIKINSNNFKEYSILAESKSDIITSILVIKNTIYFSTKGGELLKYDLNTNSL